MKKTMLFFSFLLLSCALLSQTRTIKGKVTDDNGGVLGGVSVLLKGSKVGTQTNDAGNFTLNTAKEGDLTLVFSYTGYKNNTVIADGKKDLVVKLEKSESALDDIVVVGYGTSRKKDLTSSVVSLGGKEIEKMPVTSIAEAITGRMPGVQVTTTEGAPGAEIVIRVRGGGSVTQDNSPLYIVDGFPVESISNIATTDIETFTILKDASAAAIYGSRGANGVVLITTKQAKGGKTVVNYNGYAQRRTLPKVLKVLSPYEYVLAQYEYARTRSQSEVDAFQKYFGVYEDLELYKNQTGTNWQKELFGSGGLTQQHNLIVTGGTDKTKISLGTTYNKEQGIMPGSAYERAYSNLKLNHALYSNLKLDLNVRYSNATTSGAGTSGGSSVRVGDGVTARPVNGLADFIDIDPSNIDPTDDAYEVFINSLIGPKRVIEQDYRRGNNRNITVNTALNWSIIKNLIYRTEFSIDFINTETRRYYGPLTGESKNVGENKPIGVLDNGSTQRTRFANTITYNLPKKGRHDLSIMGGAEILTGTAKSVINRAKLFDVDITPERLFANMGLGTPEFITTSINPAERLLSFFSRANYSFDDKYLLSLSFRADGSSKFVAPNQWGYFPAGSAAWRISKESFMKNASFINDLKLRVGYGQAGNNRIEFRDSRRTFTISSNRSIGFGEALQPYWAPNTLLPNPSLRWETTITRNAGLDFTLFNNKLTGVIEVYKNTTKDLLVAEKLPQHVGYIEQRRNIGQTSNKGIELSFNAPIITKAQFTLNAFFNISFNKTTVDFLNGLEEQPYNSNWAGTDLRYQDDYRVRLGQSVGLMYGFVTDGFYTTNDFEKYDDVAKKYILKAGVPDASTVLGNGVRPGSLKLKDLTNDQTISDVDRQIIGRAQPKHFGGFGFNSTYKNFDISVLCNWVSGSQVYNAGRIGFNMLYRTSYGNMLNTMNSADRYKYIDNNGRLVTALDELDKLNANAKIWSPFSMGTAAPVFHSWAVEDGSFLRVSNITVGYKLPLSLIKHAGMSQFRVFATVYNAFLFTKYTGYDPEVGATRSNTYQQLTPNVDFSAYPKSRTFTVGLNVNF